MSKLMPRLRTNLDFMPSPVPDRPGLLIRDAYRYSDVTLVVPPGLVECLRCFDGETTELELRADLVRITGDLQVTELQQNLVDALTSSGFLEDETYERLREARHREFAEPTWLGVSGRAWPFARDTGRMDERRQPQWGASAD